REGRRAADGAGRRARRDRRLLRRRCGRRGGRFRVAGALPRVLPRRAAAAAAMPARVHPEARLRLEPEGHRRAARYQREHRREAGRQGASDVRRADGRDGPSGRRALRACAAEAQRATPMRPGDAEIVQFPDHRRMREEAGVWIARIARGLSAEERRALDAWLGSDPLHPETLLSFARFWDETAIASELAEL